MNARVLSKGDRDACNQLACGLRRYGFAVTTDPRNVGCAEYSIVRRTAASLTAITFALKDWQAPTSDVVILTLTVHPEAARSKGLGTAAVTDLIEWARENGLAREIRATQVSDLRASRFWTRCGFVELPESVLGDHVRREEKP